MLGMSSQNMIQRDMLHEEVRGDIGVCDRS